ncbi:expressed unknown protein [Seminavis robusta]|uniref:G-protein coupled receptors family 1 profile domain-containing protein n=1 Tax=Seminavis robusta TaxID=568900 RepID=A0A9N8HAA6_9STRA|nr:expressed unknown protein [Seminavis robusta]|eukprot:Sro288_g108770.1 n/a (444) ;mRNA; r:28932-30263
MASKQDPIHLANVYVPKVAAFLSLVSSHVIIREVLLDAKQSSRSTPPIAKALLAISLSDVVFSIGWFLTTWPSPRDLDYLQGTNVGTIGTCTAQGFFLQLGLVASLSFNLTLATFYLLIVKYSYRNCHLQKLERWIYPGCGILALVTAVVPLPLQGYNNALEACWIAPHPFNCEFGPEDPPCTRGHHAALLVVALMILPVFLVIVTTASIMISIYCADRKLEQRNSRYLFTSSTTATITASNTPSTMPRRLSSGVSTTSQANLDRRRSQLLAQQGIYYVAAFLCAYIPALLTGIIPSILVSLIGSSLLALQGFFNLLVFMRKNRVMQTPEGKLANRVLYCCLCWGNQGGSSNARWTFSGSRGSTSRARRENAASRENIEQGGVQQQPTTELAGAKEEATGNEAATALHEQPQLLSSEVDVFDDAMIEKGLEPEFYSESNDPSY